MVKQKLLDYLWSMKDQTNARETEDQRRSGRKATKQDFLFSVAPNRGYVLWRRERETVEQAECLKYMTEVI